MDLRFCQAMKDLCKMHSSYQQLQMASNVIVSYYFIWCMRILQVYVCIYIFILYLYMYVLIHTDHTSTPKHPLQVRNTFCLVLAGGSQIPPWSPSLRDRWTATWASLSLAWKEIGLPCFCFTPGSFRQHSGGRICVDIAIESILIRDIPLAFEFYVLQFYLLSFHVFSCLKNQLNTLSSSKPGLWCKQLRFWSTWSLWWWWLSGWVPCSDWGRMRLQYFGCKKQGLYS